MYDVYNRNVSVTGADFTQKNHYDAEGYRDSITEKDKVTNFVYQGGMLLHELNEDKNPARHYVLGNEYIGLDNNYYLTDEQGSVRYVLDAAGNVQNDYRYDAFGQRIAGQENIPNRLSYNAQIEDDLTGLYYLRARYYNTGIGRFTQEDVIYNDGLNLYAYCSSNPVMYADPSGYSCEPKDGAENSKSGTSSVVNSKGVAYPEVKDIRTGQNMVFPEGVGSRVPKDSRVGWYRNQSEANLYRVNDTDILCKKDYIDEWYRRGYQTPEGGWDLYEIHHIKPREFGGSAEFENMVPLLKDVHRKVVTPWWNGYGQ